MSEASKNARRANIAKAKRLTSGSGPGKVDASSWTPSAPMKADKKTGMRPVSPRTYKHGGKVQGDRGPKRADKAPRGNLANEISTRDTKQANRDKFGSPHIGGMKKGGKAKRADGGEIPVKQIDTMGASPAEIVRARPPRVGNPRPSSNGQGPSMGGRVAGSYGGKGDWKRGGKAKQSGGPVDRTPYEDAPPPRRAIPGDAPTRGPDPKGGGRATGPKYDSIDALIRDKGLKKGGKAHSDAAQDKAMIKKMVRPAAIKRDAKCGGGRMANGGKADATGDFEVARTEKLPPKASDARQWRKTVAADKPMKNFGNIKMTSKNDGFFDLGGLGYDKPKKRKSGGSVAGGERPEGGRIPRARGGNASTYADKDDAPRLRLMKTHTDGNKTAKVYKDADWGEYRVKHYVDGKHQTKADYHTDDVSDANSTAGSFLRSQRASGGRTKGKTNINIIVNPNKAGDDQQMQPSGPIRPPPPPVMTPPAPPPGGPPPGMPPNMPPPSMAGGPPPGMPPGMPPMRARGGRLGMNKIGGSGGGLGRLEKANMR